MPAPKRPRANAHRDSPASKRRGSAKEVSNDKDNSIIKILKECSQKQQHYIACMERFLLFNKCRFQRLRCHLHHHLVIEMKRARVRNAIEEQIKEYEKELAGQNAKEAMLKLAVKEMSEQEDKLENIVKDIVKHKGHRIQCARKMIRSEPNQYGRYEEELTDALQRVPAINRGDAGMAALPKLREMDLDDIEWPEIIYNWSHYSIYWNSELEEATVCRSLNERIKILNRQLEEEVSDYKEVQTRKYTIKLYDESFNCPIHVDRIRNFERTALTEQLEQLILKIFGKKASIEKLEVEKESLEASRKQREDLLKSIQEEMNTDSLKCSVCFEALTNGEQSLRCPQQFGSCGHTVCATCMTQFKARDSPYHWTCPQCRAPSDKVLTNWALMQLIKEIPGQAQRVMVETPQAVPIVPAEFRLERRRDPEPVLQEEVILMEDIDDIMERRRRRLEDLNNRRVNRDLEVLPPPRERDQMIDNPVQRNQMAPAPPVRHNPLPMAPALPVRHNPLPMAPAPPVRHNPLPMAPAPPIRHNPPPRAPLPMAPPLRAWAPVAQDLPAPAPAVPGFLNPPIPIPADPDLIPIFLREPFAAPWAPFPPLVDPDFDPFFVPQPFQAPWAPPAPVAVGQLAPAPQLAPQNLQAGHIDRMDAEWGIDEEQEDLQDARYRGVPPSPEPERDSDEEDDGEEDFILH
ncbi:unnamed protein product [Caenorhabditis brenneri]